MVTVECTTCGARFEAETKRAKYCSDACKQEAYRLRHGGTARKSNRNKRTVTSTVTNVTQPVTVRGDTSLGTDDSIIELLRAINDKLAQMLESGQRISTPLPAHTVSGPPRAYHTPEDTGGGITVKKAEGGNSGQNFLNSLMALQRDTTH
jgi:hypothetical protein